MHAASNNDSQSLIDYSVWYLSQRCKTAYERHGDQRFDEGARASLGDGTIFFKTLSPGGKAFGQPRARIARY